MTCNRMFRCPRLAVALVVVGVAAFALAPTDVTATTPQAAPRLSFASSDLRQIEVVDTGTGEARTVVSAGISRAVADPSWSPDDQRLAYGDTLGVAEPVLGELRIIEVARRRTTTVVSLPTLYVHQVAWSPRGDRIAFTTSTVYTPLWGVALSHQSVHVVDVDGDDHLILGPGTDPAWSPDGTRVAFAASGDIRVVDPDHLVAAHTVGLPLSTDAQPRWSPDGTRLAFTSSGVLGTPMVWVGRADGSALRPYLAFTWSAPTWSPDGRSFAYEDRGLVVVNLQSGARRRVSFDEDGGSRAPSWSTSGLIAFSRDRTIETVDANTAVRRVVARRSASPRLAWSA